MPSQTEISNFIDKNSLLKTHLGSLGSHTNFPFVMNVPSSYLFNRLLAMPPKFTDDDIKSEYTRDVGEAIRVYEEMKHENSLFIIIHTNNNIVNQKSITFKIIPNEVLENFVKKYIHHDIDNTHGKHPTSIFILGKDDNYKHVYNFEKHTNVPYKNIKYKVLNDSIITLKYQFRIYPRINDEVWNSFLYGKDSMKNDMSVQMKKSTNINHSSELILKSNNYHFFNKLMLVNPKIVKIIKETTLHQPTVTFGGIKNNYE